ncbi:MAG: cytochrome b [Hahellaceae bacterium]|nr:cytochrome b [Hahellaceae bacterium]
MDIIEEQPTRYHAVSIFLHWFMLVQIMVVYGLIELREWIPKDTGLRPEMKNWHAIIGLSVLVLVVIRLLMRVLTPTPAIKPPPHLLQLRIGQTAHMIFYLFMIAMPLLGWLYLNAIGKPIPLFGFDLPALIGADKSLARDFKELHEVIGRGAYFLIALHAAAALHHHYFLRDDTLVRMMPWVKPRHPIPLDER